MIGFREYCEEGLDESLIRFGSVAAFAAQGKRHGDSAVQHYRRSQNHLRQSALEKTSDRKWDHLAASLAAALDGLIETREQIGAISAQVTASVVTNRR